MKNITITIALFISLVLINQSSLLAQDANRLITDQEEFARQVELPSSTRIIEIRHRGGNLNITGWDKPYVLIEGTKKATAETVDYARIILEKIEIIAYERPQNRLVLEFVGPPNEWRIPRNDVSISYTARIPKNFSCDISLTDGDVYTSELNGRLSIDHRTGNVIVSDIANRVQVRSSGGLIKIDDLSRDLKLDTRDSKIEINNIANSCAVRHRNGDIRINNVNDTLILNTMRGNVTLNEIKGRLDIDHRDGDLIAERFHDGVRIYLYNGQTRLAPQIPIPHNYYIVVDKGDVTLRVPERSSMLAEIEAQQGSIHSDFPMPIWANKAVSTSKGAINGGERIVNISVKNGHVSLFKETGNSLTSSRGNQIETTTPQPVSSTRTTQPIQSQSNNLQSVEIP